MLIAVGCCQKNCTSWNTWCSSPACPKYYSAKLSNEICNPFREIKFELVRTGDDWRGLFIVQNIPLIPTDCSERTISISINIDGEEEKIIQGIVFEGGQEVLLTPDDSISIIEALLNQNEVNVRIDNYCSTLPFRGFKEAYITFCR